MTNYVRRGRYLVARNSDNAHLGQNGSVRRVTGRNGTTVLQLGPTFAEPVEAIRQDPTANLMAELKGRKIN